MDKMTTDTITTVYLITAVCYDDTPLGSTPREVLYGNSPRAYATPEEAADVAGEWNRRAEDDNWPWRYEVDPIPLSALPDAVRDYIDAEPLAGLLGHLGLCPTKECPHVDMPGFSIGNPCRCVPAPGE